MNAERLHVVLQHRDLGRRPRLHHRQLCAICGVDRHRRLAIDADGGQSFTFDGICTLMDVRYNFRCHVFADAGGQRFVSDVALFEPVEWETRMAL